MIIDCHGHYTTEPKDLHRFRKDQTEGVKNKSAMPPRAGLKMSDDEIRESLEQNQIKLQKERGTDVTIFSPRASGMGHHVGDESVSIEWTQICNDLIHRCVSLFPKNFIGVCQLPQSLNVAPGNSAKELERCVNELGFVGCNLNPDPSGGYFNSPPLTDKWWYPLYEKMVELDVPGMVHVSGCANPAMHTTGSYYLNADTMAFVQLILSDLFKDFPKLRLIIPHGGGAIPFHWGRFRGIALNAGRPELSEIMANNIFFDTCVYHQPGIDLLFKVVPVDNILFASEMVGAVKGNDPRTGFGFDDTKRYVEGTSLSAADKAKVFEGNARKVYPRINKKLAELRARDGRTIDMAPPDDRSVLQRRFGTDEPHLDLPADAPAFHAQLAARGVVRSFSSQPVPFDLLHRLCALALCAPTKSDLQQRDIVIVDDPSLKREILSPLTEGPIGQPWLADVPALLIFCGNNRRQRLWHEWRGKPFANDHLDAFFNASVDAGHCADGLRSGCRSARARRVSDQRHPQSRGGGVRVAWPSSACLSGRRSCRRMARRVAEAKHASAARRNGSSQRLSGGWRARGHRGLRPPPRSRAALSRAALRRDVREV